MQQAQLSRRRFLISTGALPAGVGLAGSLGTPASAQDDFPTVPEEWPVASDVPETPDSQPSDTFQVFTQAEAAVVEALTARILPGTPDDPGAREAGVVYYIDHKLSQQDGIVTYTYRTGPWARPYEGDTPPEPEDGVVWVPASEIRRYGYQSQLSPVDIYRAGIASLEAYAELNYGGRVPELSEEDQDQIIWDMLDENIDDFTEFSSIAFFQTLRMDTAEGMFSDPAYGGNRNMAGWVLVGFPGAQRAYAPSEMQVEQHEPREPQTMHGLPEFNPGQPEDGPVLPVRGTEEHEHDSGE